LLIADAGGIDVGYRVGWPGFGSQSDIAVYEPDEGEWEFAGSSGIVVVHCMHGLTCRTVLPALSAIVAYRLSIAHMSPPKYQPLPQVEDGISGESYRTDSPPTYPPREAQLPLASGSRSNVIYTFQPRYPLRGNAEDALGILGLDRDVRIPLSIFDKSRTLYRSFSEVFPFSSTILPSVSNF
jgi:hypothetical protein